MTVVHVLAATAISGVMQSVLGGQPLLIVGVAEPIVLIYSFMYEVCWGREGQGGVCGCRCVAGSGEAGESL